MPISSRSNMEFQHSLNFGLDKEKTMANLLTANGITWRKNNVDNDRDIDFYLPNAKMYLECKSTNVSFPPVVTNAIKEDSRLPLNIYHLNNYVRRQFMEGKHVIIGYLIDFKEYNIKEERFFLVSDILKWKNKHPECVWYSIKDNYDKLAINREDGITLQKFCEVMQRFE